MFLLLLNASVLHFATVNQTVRIRFRYSAQRNFVVPVGRGQWNFFDIVSELDQLHVQNGLRIFRFNLRQFDDEPRFEAGDFANLSSTGYCGHVGDRSRFHLLFYIFLRSIQHGFDVVVQCLLRRSYLRHDGG